MGMRWWCGKL